MSSYFSSFAGFVASPQASFQTDFERLSKHQGWAKGSKEWKRQRSIAVQADFTYHYGENAAMVDGWKALCMEIGIEPVPNSITQCKKEISGKLVNIYDLLDARRNGTTVKVFTDFKAFRRHTQAGKVYPRHQAKQSVFLRALLKTLSG